MSLSSRRRKEGLISVLCLQRAWQWVRQKTPLQSRVTSLWEPLHVWLWIAHSFYKETFSCTLFCKWHSLCITALEHRITFLNWRNKSKELHLYTSKGKNKRVNVAQSFFECSEFCDLGRFEKIHSPTWEAREEWIIISGIWQRALSAHGQDNLIKIIKIN